MDGLSDTITVYAFNAKHKESTAITNGQGVDIYASASTSNVYSSKAVYWDDRLVLKSVGSGYSKVDWHQIMYVKQTRSVGYNATTGYINVNNDYDPNTAINSNSKRSRSRFYTYGIFEWSPVTSAKGD